MQVWDFQYLSLCARGKNLPVRSRSGKHVRESIRVGWTGQWSARPGWRTVWRAAWIRPSAQWIPKDQRDVNLKLCIYWTWPSVDLENRAGQDRRWFTTCFVQEEEMWTSESWRQRIQIAEDIFVMKKTMFWTCAVSSRGRTTHSTSASITVDAARYHFRQSPSSRVKALNWFWNAAKGWRPLNKG